MPIIWNGRGHQASRKIIAEELEKFNQWLGTLYVVPVITTLKSQAEAIKMQELNKAMNRLGKYLLINKRFWDLWPIP